APPSIFQVRRRLPSPSSVAGACVLLLPAGASSSLPAVLAEVEQIVSEYSDIQFLEENDLSLYLEQLTAELKTTEAENNDLCNEIEELKQTQIGSACQLEGELETLNYVLDNYKPMDNREVRERAPVDGSNQSGTCRLSKEHDE
ncbi:hypothetical protein V2J09_003892, partial [Rumex salicifolius]